jgi:SAM-dependent methyltransferase
LRLIATTCRVARCTLLDPLIDSYLGHPNHTYDREWLRSDASRLSRVLGKNRPLRAVRRVLRALWPASLGTKTPVDRLLATSIEDMPVEGTYDLIVIINVIEHCYDIDRVFGNILKIAKPGAILVFADRYYDHETVAGWVQGKRYDAGHPLLVDRSVINEFLHTNCDTLYEGVRQHEWVVEGFDFSHEAVYFVGRIRG